MKKILIVNKTFGTGGIQSSLINMANELSKEYEVHLLVYDPEGNMKDRLDSKVKVLDSSWRLRALGKSLPDVTKTGNLKMIAYRYFATVWTKLVNNALPIRLAIKHQPKLSGYDLAISYHQEQPKNYVLSGFSRVVDQCVEADKKVAWLHCDMNASALDSDFNSRFYEKMDRVVCVSAALMDGVAKHYPKLKGKIDYCYNFLPYDLIREKAEQPQAVPYPSDKTVCFSACRLAEVKALERGVCAVADVLKQHGDIIWYIAGDGPERKNIEKAIHENGVEEYVRLIGNQSNPYPYMKNADLVMNVSYHEAAPMVFFESKALGTPVFATQTGSTSEVLHDGQTDFVCGNSAEEIRERFAYIMEHRQLISAAKRELAGCVMDNDASLEKIKNLIG